MADVTDVERLNYYEGEYLGAVDFEAEQEYHRDMRRRHNIGPHTWGIVTGLDVAQFLNGGTNNEVDVFIQPGVAVDGFGREIVVFSPYQLTSEMFADFPAKQTLTLWIGYSQQLINPDSDTCASASQTNAYSRVQESFQIVVQPFPPTSDPVYVGGNVVAPPSASTWTQPATLPPLPSTEGAVVIALDDSVPFQELPDDNTTANWLIPLGQILWDGTNQVFVQSADGTANQNRRYAGSVASAIYAPAGILTIQDRNTLSSAIAGGAPTSPATIAGYNASGGVVTLTVSPALATAYTAGQIVIFTGFSSGLAGLNGRGYAVLSSPSPGTSTFAITATSVSGAGTDTGTATPQPLGVAVEVQGTLTVDEQLTAQQDVWLNGGNLFALRFKDAGGTDAGTALNLQRLDASSGGADLHIHIGDGSSPQTKMQQLTVGYGTGLPTADTNAFIVGCDGNAQIPQGSLTFATQTAQALNLLGTNYGIGAQAETLYFRSGSDFAWYLNGQYSPSQDSPGIGGSLNMLLDSSGDLTINGALVVDNANLNKGLSFGNASGEGINSQRTSGVNQNGLDFYTAFDVRMSIDHSGNVGIGTQSPGSSLDVRGNVASNSVFGFSNVQQSTSPYGVFISAPSSQTMGLFTNFNQQLTISSSGEVGIGTTSPGSALDVRGNIATNSVFGFSTVQQATSPYGVFISAPTSQTMGLFTNSNQQMTISSSGNVGIGNTNPQAPLHIGTFGPFIFTGGGGSATSYASSAVGFNMYRGSDNNWHTINDGVNGGGCVIYGNTDGDLYVAQVPTAGATTQSLSDGSLYPSHIVFSIAAGSPATVTVNGKLKVTGSKSGYVVDRFLSRTKKQFQQGDVVVLHAKPSPLFYGVENRIPLVEVTLATKAGDTRVCGVVDEPVLSADEILDLDQNSLGKGTVGLMVTLGAYAYCKVDADIAPIAAGDLLTTSSTAGHAQRFDPKMGSATGCIIGKALASLAKGKGKIPILISHQ
ncbi:hypothetical protein [Granulicella sp. L46]|uniref:hypothetical protein n=1 Tax=Granulicella sp. L46 TaxID=1641865 RepID=UPI00131B1682|nr:hypothetical protein [Granulicella sp. L46]